MNRHDEILKGVMDWYSKQCNEDWEHQNGVCIDTLDNPGWIVKIDLEETICENMKFDTIEKDYSEHNWYHCLIKDHQFRGTGGPFNLSDILSIFLEWAKKCEEENPDRIA